MGLWVSSATAQSLVPAPSEFTAAWLWPAPAKVKLTWEQPPGTNGSTVYLVQRRYGSTDVATGWTTIHNGTVNTEAGSDTVRTVTDTALSATSAFRYLFYRIRTMSGTATGSVVTSGAAETALLGNPAQGSTGESFDSDADGIPDFVESTYSNGKPGANPGDPADGQNPLNSTDWTDGSGDADGDGIPNAWEYALSGAAAMYDPDPANSPVAKCTVNRSLPIQISTWPRNYHTISTAIAALPAASATHPTTFRIIRVSPGIYEENLSISTTLEVAIIPERPELDFDVEGQTYTLYEPDGHFEIRGTHATDPVVEIVSSHVVLDGFIIGRKAGTSGPVVSIAQTNTPIQRYYLTRLVNCLFRNNNTGSAAVIAQNRSRLVLSHCTFFMNAANNQALGTALSCGRFTDSSTASFLVSTADTRVHNCIFWNPVNTTVPEYQSEGPLQFVSSIVHQRRLADGSLPPDVPGILPGGTDPYLNPLGYLVGPTKTEQEDPAEPGTTVTTYPNTGAMGLGTANLHVRRDMHGEWRTNEAEKIDLGSHQWSDDDVDGIPNFADTLNLWDLDPDSSITDPEDQMEDWITRAAANNGNDFDADGISELQEYLYGTDMQNADTYFLSIHQAMRMFAPLGEGAAATGLTMQEVLNSFFTKLQSDARFWRKTEVIRIPQAGDLLMGDYTVGPSLP